MPRRKRASPEPATDPGPLTPAARARGTPEGTPVALADGAEWTLADSPPSRSTGDVWDNLYDHNVLRGRYATGDVLAAAFRLLRANYRLTHAETFDLLRHVEPASLVPAVERAAFGPDREHVTESLWEWSALVANGIDPDTVDPGRKRFLLRQLVMAGRAVPEERFVSSQEAMARRKQLLDFGKDRR